MCSHLHRRLAGWGRPSLRYVALGDSYTIGTSVGPAERFPDQLTASLRGTGPGLRLVANLAVNGYTTADLIRDELPALDALETGFATLLIGVNDVVRGVGSAVYETNVATLLDTLVARLPADRIVTVSIPDYTVTPAGADYGDPGRKRAAIVANNVTMAHLSMERSIRFVDILDVSQHAAEDRTLVASDGLHPSGAQYARWVERIRPVVARTACVTIWCSDAQVNAKVLFQTTLRYYDARGSTALGTHRGP